MCRRHPERSCIWLHAVSVGEVNAARTVIERLRERFPDREIMLTTTTDTGFDRATVLYGGEIAVSYFPLDFSFSVRRALRRVRPAVCVLVELEVWPNFVREARGRGIPVIVINGRISDKSHRGYMKILPLVKKTFGTLSLVLAQSAGYALKFQQLGVPPGRIAVTGSLKYDTAEIAERVDGADLLAAQLGLSSRLLVAGATGNEEEQIVIDAYEELLKDEGLADLRLAIVPRKPERFDEVAELIESRSHPLLRYSLLKDGMLQAVTPAGDAVILGDTMGDLRRFYSLASVIFTGRSLVPMGGSDMIEAAALGKPTVFGPHTFNFTETADALIAAGGALRVEDSRSLARAVGRLLREPDFAAATAAAGRKVIIDRQGATERTVGHIAALLTKLEEPS
jgi:3-deoxy-D-manno-octulosonic-acid transferase